MKLITTPNQRQSSLAVGNADSGARLSESECSVCYYLLLTLGKLIQTLLPQFFHQLNMKYSDSYFNMIR